MTTQEAQGLKGCFTKRMQLLIELNLDPESFELEKVQPFLFEPEFDSDNPPGHDAYSCGSRSKWW